MTLGKSERAVIYGSDSMHVQMGRWLLNRPDRMATISELRDFFSDVSAGAFYSVLSTLIARRIVSIEGETVTMSAEQISLARGERSDMVWRAVRILKVFTAKEIQKLLPELPRRTVLDILSALVDAGAIKRDGRSSKNETVFRLITDAKVRPVFRKERAPGKVDVIWDIIRDFGSSVWTSGDIKADERWVQIGAAPRYLEELLRQWRGEGIIEEVDAETRSRREPKKYRTAGDGNRSIVFTHYGRKNGKA